MALLTMPGSIRSPAANNGVYGLKPTAFRIPTDGWSSSAPGADAIVAVIGPISTSLEGIKLFMQTVLAAKPWLSEPALIPLPWNYHAIPASQPLRIGVMWHDDVVKPHPPITRALTTIVERLRALPSVSIVDWKPHLHDEAWAIISSLYYPDGGAEDTALLAESGEPWRPLTKWVIKENPCVTKLNMQKYFYWQEEREAYRSEYAKAWNATVTGKVGVTGELQGVVDVILCPAGPGVAPRHNTARYWGYTSVWNLLDYPAAVFPVTKADAQADRVEEGYQPMNETDRENWALCESTSWLRRWRRRCE
jgi:Asp-tRNA(Asn)/Glu-tRNA(Gln) amidotransferase A subunit family amidase